MAQRKWDFGVTIKGRSPFLTVMTVPSASLLAHWRILRSSYSEKALPMRVKIASVEEVARLSC